MQSLGAPQGLVRRYAYRNAVLPQLSGSRSRSERSSRGTVTEIVFSYPGLGTLIITALQNRDYFLLQGLFLFIVIGVLVANFLVDIAYVIVDPRTRTGIQGSDDDWHAIEALDPLSTGSRHPSRRRRGDGTRRSTSRSQPQAPHRARGRDGVPRPRDRGPC